MNNLRELREQMEADGWAFEKESWYDEEGVEGTRLIAPDGTEFTTFGWDDDIDEDRVREVLEEYTSGKKK